MLKFVQRDGYADVDYHHCCYQYNYHQHHHYQSLSNVMALRMLSSAVAKRFPSYQHLVQVFCEICYEISVS